MCDDDLSSLILILISIYSSSLMEHDAQTTLNAPPQALEAPGSSPSQPPPQLPRHQWLQQMTASSGGGSGDGILSQLTNNPLFSAVRSNLPFLPQLWADTPPGFRTSRSRCPCPLRHSRPFRHDLLSPSPHARLCRSHRSRQSLRPSPKLDDGPSTSPNPR